MHSIGQHTAVDQIEMAYSTVMGASCDAVGSGICKELPACMNQSLVARVSVCGRNLQPKA